LIWNYSEEAHVTTLEMHSKPASTFVPVIDVAPFLHGSEAEKRQVARDVDKASREVGFYVVVGHGVDSNLVPRMEAISREFFDQPLDEKMKLHVSAHSSSVGYAAVGDNNLSYTRGEAKPFDLVESLIIAPIDVPDDPYYGTPDALPLFPANQWPTHPAELRAIWSDYYRRMQLLADDLMRLSAVALDLPKDYFQDKIDRNVSKLTAKLYPPQKTEPLPGQLRSSAHTDFGTVTILKPGDAPGGLQVADAEGNWHDVPMVPGSFVINLGDLMQRWTNDHWRSALHRVVNPPAAKRATSSRLSIVFFHHPNYDVTVSCLPSLLKTGEQPRHAPIGYSDFYRLRLDQRRAKVTVSA
jgi:isopenicillin N synthase-like dioxygenase